MIIVVCARPGDDVMIDGKEYYLFDTGLAVQNMLLVATEDIGLVTHPIASFRETGVKRVLHIPDEVRIVIVTPLAYPNAASYNEAAEGRLSQRNRKDLKELVYFNKWGS